MPKLYFGKISKTYPIQFEKNFYAGGKKESQWYGGIQPGDYVFPIYNGKVSKLWQVKEFLKGPNEINDDDYVTFNIIKEYNNPPSISTEFLSYMFFEIDLNLVNKSVKSVKQGFFEITLSKNDLLPKDIDFNDKRHLFIILSSSINNISFKNRDVIIIINNRTDFKIQDIKIYENDKLIEYKILKKLYEERNKSNERYSLLELLNFAKEDNAIKKEKYLSAVMTDLKEKGIFIASSPVSLYDNILVGRKKSLIKKDQTNEDDIIDEEADDIDSLEEYSKYKKLLEKNPNLILFGPPGTGKTYTVQKIVEYIENQRTGNFISFQNLLKDQRVEFITFHQSFSYEEFIEGLRPVINELNENNETNDLKYKVEDGILKKLANRASLSQLKNDDKENLLKNVNNESTIYKVSLGQKGTDDEDVYKDCKNKNAIAIGWLADEDLNGKDYDYIYQKLSEERGVDQPKPTHNANSVDTFINKLKIGDIVLIYNGPYTIRDIGIINGNYYYDKNSLELFPHRRSVIWIKHFEEPYNISKINGGKRLTLKTVYELTDILFSDLKELLQSSNDKKNISSKSNTVPFYLIIDEINRGNISKIFGELITLIEKDKRENIRITLPYSRKQFSLPSNLFIIGTMNTADRSIAIIDTALRRRFLFSELQPDIEVINRSENKIIENDIDLSELFKIINDRVSIKYDRDHKLGHSYFLEIYNIDDLKINWYYKIIPLLMEYFYNDLETISYIISDKFIDKDKCNIIWIENDKDFKDAIINIYKG